MTDAVQYVLTFIFVPYIVHNCYYTYFVISYYWDEENLNETRLNWNLFENVN